MDNFLEINQDWFSKKYLPLLGRRFWSFKIALNLFKQFGGRDMVETGCLRKKDDWEAGYSTYILADFARFSQSKLHSIDNSEEHIETARKICEEFREFVEFHKGDSIEILKNWNKPIDFLFLDSKDCDPSDEAVSKEAQEHQLAELKAAEPNLTGRAIVLLDDNYFANGGKTRLAKEYLEKKGFLLIMDYEQSLWVFSQ